MAEPTIQKPTTNNISSNSKVETNSGFTRYVFDYNELLSACQDVKSQDRNKGENENKIIHFEEFLLEIGASIANNNNNKL